MGFLSSLTGSDAAGAAEGAGAHQARIGKIARGTTFREGRRAEDMIREGFEPYTSPRAFNQMNRLSRPGAQQRFLENNPMFQAAVAQGAEGINRGGAMSGKNVTADLFQNYLAQGNEVINQQFNRLAPLAQMGMGASTGMASNLANIRQNTAMQRSDLLTSGGAARAAGWVGAANARSQGLGNIAGLAAQGAGMMMGVPPAGLMGGQAASNVVQPQGVGATQATINYGY